MLKDKGFIWRQGSEKDINDIAQIEQEATNIAVKPTYQSQGVGTEMLDCLLDYAEQQKLALVLLEVRRSNIKAQKLYEKKGFNEMSVRRNYYPSHEGREDAILMGLDLTFLHFDK